MAVYVAMLRGINVGGQKSIKMDDLRATFESLGYDGVKTYLQSGNVVFKAPEVSIDDLTESIGKRILHDFGFQVVLILRTSLEMEKIVRANPFLKEKGIDHSKLHVTFLSDPPAKTSIKNLEGLNGAPDLFRVIGREVYLYCPSGYGRSKLSNNAIEKALSVKATTRNWNTVNALAKLPAEQIPN